MRLFQIKPVFVERLDGLEGKLAALGRDWPSLSLVPVYLLAVLSPISVSLRWAHVSGNTSVAYVKEQYYLSQLCSALEAIYEEPEINTFTSQPQYRHLRNPRRHRSQHWEKRGREDGPVYEREGWYGPKGERPLKGILLVNHISYKVKVSEDNPGTLRRASLSKTLTSWGQPKAVHCWALLSKVNL